VESPYVFAILRRFPVCLKEHCQEADSSVRTSSDACRLGESRAWYQGKSEGVLSGWMRYTDATVPSDVFLPMHTLAPMDGEQIRNCIRHECTYYKRGDQFVNLLLLLLNALYWFNPFVGVAFFQIRGDMESACDSAVVRYMNSSARRDYATLILGMFSQEKHRQIALGMVQGNTKKAAGKRIRGVFMSNKTNTKVKVIDI